ncbi:erythromycin esterase family protein [Streptomyces sp. AA0539]|uniref:erythromycin esterase family protein n=1 Tax=Streptomyces sp. AA0539 TaxID=1210045 RepID=UPI0002F2F31D|nr:erythromycin esterase family protein [Streptomyces sp. AA0539]
MPGPARPTPFTDLLRQHAIELTELDPEAPLEDLEPLRDLIGDARVVALGENSHFIDEFAALRERLLRFLVERCGFTLLAFEYGFAEALPLDAWARGEGSEDSLAGHLAGTIPIGVEAPLRRIRRYNRTAAAPVRFAGLGRVFRIFAGPRRQLRRLAALSHLASTTRYERDPPPCDAPHLTTRPDPRRSERHGLDVPAAGGSLRPALAPVIDHLRRVDPETVPAAERALRLADRFAGGSAAVTAPAWARLTTAEQDDLTATLARLLLRFRALEPLYAERGGRPGYDLALRLLEGACHADHGFRAMAGLFAGEGLPGDTSARDSYLAGSLLWHLERSAPGTRVVLAAHNAHLQTVPISFDGRLTGIPMGRCLRDALGDDYLAIGLTAVTGHTADMPRDESAPFGFTVAATALAPPEPGSVEAAFAGAGLGSGTHLADLRPLRGRAADPPDRIRLQGSYLHTPVVAAYDAMLCTGGSTVTRGLGAL